MKITADRVEKIMKNLRFRFPYTPQEYSENLYLENYHCHKDFSNVSTPDSAESLENYVVRIKELHGSCLYSGEHGNQGDQFLTYKLAEQNGLKYRHSAEAYWVKDRHEQDRTNCHIILVAKNPEGRKDINYILSIANEDGYYYKPRIDLDLLLSVPSENIIVTSACVAGWKYEDAEQIWVRVAEHFGDNFFLEVQNHNTDEQKELNRKIISLSRRMGIQIICGLDTHYISHDSEVKRDQILKYKHIDYPEESGWYMDYPDTLEVIRRFEEQGVLSEDEILTAIMNTMIFIDGCEDIHLDRSFKIPSLYKGKSYDEKVKIYKQKLNEAYRKEKFKSPEKKKGIIWEAEQVIDSGVVDYFLTSSEIVKKAVNDYGGILTTTSRGSAASFVSNKLLGLTTVDRYTSEIPIYPERFLTKERVLANQMPDIDLNCAENKPFVDAARELLGEHSCYPLMAVEKLKEKAAWQLYAGSNGVEPSVANQVSKYLDAYNKAVKYSENEDRDSVNLDDYIPGAYRELYQQSREYQNITINLKVHACGHLLLDGDIRREIGLISAVSETTKKRTLCAAVEGKYLDEFGYVKEDFLIVDSVHLTHNFFESIGEEVPSFDELKRMVDGDKDTWGIYEKGITCCVNQCEKEATTRKAMKYKPKNIGELSAFIAGVRPGFASLLNTFLSRREYTTGEKEIDDLLSDSAHFMIYQESIMKVLSFLKLDLGETYGIIKSISKKKLKGERKEKLLAQLKKNWLEIFHNLDNFNNVWDVIEDSAAYAFNAPHAYSMAGDSLYQAWFKAHHTAKFYEVAIAHYQTKGNKAKINALVQEAVKFYGYKVGDYGFGNDNRTVNVDEENKTIYPNLSSIKGFGEKVSQTLYRLGKNEYLDFVDLMTDMLKNGINKTVVENLIRIGYFGKFGDVNTLLETKKIYEQFYGIKQISKEKVSSLGYDLGDFIQYGSETAKLVRDIDSRSLVKHLVKKIPYRELTVREQLDNQYDVLGIVNTAYPNNPKREYYVADLSIKKSVVETDLFEIFSGKMRHLKIWTSQYDRLPFTRKDILTLSKIRKEAKREAAGFNPKTGKMEYVPVEGQWEYWLEAYRVEQP